MPVSTQHVKFTGRKPSPAKVKIAMQGDHNAEVLHLDLPNISEEQTAFLLVTLPDGSAGDSIQIDESGNVDFTRTITQFSGLMMGYVQINVNDSIIWHSDILYLEIGALPSAEKGMEAAYPSAFEQALERMLSLLSITEASADEAVKSAQEAKDSEIISEHDARIVKESMIEAREYSALAESARNEAVSASEHTQQAKDSSLESMNIAVHKAAEAHESAQIAVESRNEVTLLEHSTQQAKEQAEAAALEALSAAEEALLSRLESRHAREDAQAAEEAKRVSVESRDTAVQAKEEAVNAKNETIRNAISAEESAQYAADSEQASLNSELAAWRAKNEAELARDLAREYGQRVTIEGSTLIIGGD